MNFIDGAVTLTPLGTAIHYVLHNGENQSINSFQKGTFMYFNLNATC